MNGRRVLALSTRIVRQFRRDRRSIALLFIAPVLILSLIAQIYGNPSNTITLAVVNPGESPIATQMINSLRDDPTLTIMEMDAGQAMNQLRARQVDALLTLPPDLDTQSDATPQQIEVILEGTEPSTAASVLTTLNRVLPQTIVHMLNPNGVPLEIEPHFLHGGPEFDQLDYLAPSIIGLFAFLFVFLLTSVSFLRERMTGSFERLMVSPLSRGEIVLGYMLGFTIFATLQSLVMVLFSIYVLQIDYTGSIWLVFFFTLLLTLGAVNLGIFLSTFARTELQVVQFIPIIITPQVLLSGIIWQTSALPGPLQVASRVMPLTWANQALRDIMIAGQGLPDLWMETLILAGFAALMVLLGSSTLRREVA